MSKLIKRFSNVSVASSRIPIEAGNLRIQCDVADDSTSSIAWFKDNRPLDDTLPNVAFEDDFRRLVLLAFGPSDRGVYMCLTGGQNWHSAAQELIYINSGTIYLSGCPWPLSWFKRAGCPCPFLYYMDLPKKKSPLIYCKIFSFRFF